MRAGALHGDVSLVEEGLELFARFGFGSLEELARTAWEVERGVYRPGSMVRTEAGVAVPLRNPPLRIGAFRSIAVAWDGTLLDGSSVTVSTDRSPGPRPIASVTAALPLELELGEGSRFELALPEDPGKAPHRVRIEWRSLAIPPLVWLELRDVVAERERGP